LKSYHTGGATARKLIDALLALETIKDVRTLRPLLQKRT